MMADVVEAVWEGAERAVWLDLVEAADVCCCCCCVIHA